MLSNRRKIKLMAIWGAGFTVGSIFLLFMILLFAIIPAGMPLSLISFADLFRENNVLYLLNIIPLFAAFAGAFAGRKISDIKDNADKKISVYENTINRTVEFVEKIKKEDLHTPFVAVNGEKVLETALEEMRMSLISSSLKESERSEVNRLSREISTLLQSFNDIDQLSEEIIAFLVRKLENVVQGAFYVVEGENDDDKLIVMKASYAYNRKKYMHKEFMFAQGLIGQAAVEKDIIVRTEIPDDYMTITSGLLGTRKPESILIHPLISNDIVYGVIELASFQKFSALQCSMIKEVSKIIARTIANVRINQKTFILLQESEKMSSELRHQKKQLIQNAEDLIKTRDELKRSNIKLEEQIQEVYNTGKRTQVLLENAKEVIIIFSEELKILYVSPSIKSILGYYPDELLGKDDAENVHPLDTDKFRQLLSDQKSFPEKELTLQYRYFTKDGEVIWMEATGKNLLSDDVIKGIVINSRDISEQRIAIKEQRMRAKMQALSENSSDIIIRIDIFSRCTYINPVIEEFTGSKKDAYINKAISNTNMDPGVISVLKRMLEEVSLSKVKKSEEMIFPTTGGNQVMHVNAIPEFSENGETESVLFVCHNITEAKTREEIIRKKNKSISDSINYAYNIQSALMPTEDNLHKALPNSFMFYKPKDVVSGDYPWLYRHEESIYIGAMDCTGHGVPGALMSIIGFFLQNAIISGREELNAGEVLNQLHKSVVRTLKQEEPQSKINDGMDAAFCRINLKKKELDFAGAHRPMFHVSKGVLTEIRGDKFPVGSTQYRNRRDFTNHTLKIRPGDAIYFMTDGYTDQFGGAAGKQKFSSERVGQMIRDNSHLSIFQMGNLFRKSYDEWKGEVNQLDDVLVIGIKF
jgi:PAS domain S-box-containing protein